jgi:2,4-dienoyl-CoA reductase-like NADH-dependent reductase (Old Yellow Enzyme family)
MTATILSEPLTLPCGSTIPNRLCKAAMTEGLATKAGEASEALTRLYGTWSDGGSGLLLSGNILIDAYHLERPGNVIIDGPITDSHRENLTAWAAAATRNGNHFWAQISHAGRQTQKVVNPHPKAPSAVKLGLPGGQFGEPVALAQDEIQQIIERFANCAEVVKSCGFTGVQIHAAHGYLMSQFLSPRSNQRTDEYGGSLENRARLLIEVFRAVRARVGADFPVAVKLNSADFQRGGFDFEESLQVAQWLQDEGVDLIEVSGGTYEQPKLLNLEGIEPVDEQKVAASTLAREAYFVDFTRAMRKTLTVPLMVTGGLRKRSAMEEVITSGAADMVGLGRPLCVMTDAPKQLLSGLEELPRYENQLSLLPSWLGFLSVFKLFRTIGAFATQYWYYEQIALVGERGKAADALTVLSATTKQTKRANAWLQGRAPAPK